MSNTKTVMGQASNQYVTPLQLEELFSTYLYEGTGSAQTITNGLDLDGEGGLVWIKDRSTTEQHVLTDTERGATKFIKSNSTGDEQTNAQALTSFNSSGFSVGNYADVNQNTDDFASWTFRKAPKFFDVVTYTGNDTAGRTISHNLGSVPGMIVVKSTSSAGPWAVYHRGSDATAPEDKELQLNATDAAVNGFTTWNRTAPTSTEFTLGTEAKVNGPGISYVAYLFAHNDGDGGFGAGDDDIIKCGSLTISSQATVDVNLGFEAQWVMLKSASGTGNWFMFDVMRGMAVSGFEWLYANASDAAEVKSYQSVFPTATGFSFDPSQNGQLTDGTYIYMAIRRGTKVPESGTEVFAVDLENSSAPYYTSNFPVDFGLQKRKASSGDWYTFDRLRGTKILKTNLTNAESTDNSGKFDYMDGFISSAAYGAGNSYGWMWKRAPGYFDAVAYSGNSTNNRELKHNLNVIPEMVWFKSRSDVKNWAVYTSATGNNNTGTLNSTAIFEDNSAGMYSSPTKSSIFLKNTNENNGSGSTYIAYLFASLPGISKVGSYTGNGSTSGPTVDCGFSGGPRFVLIKRTANTGGWYLFDSLRGIVAGNESQLYLNSDADEQTATDQIDPTSSGFQIVTNATGLNGNGETYIFYAIA